MELIGSYIGALSAALHGPRRVKLDLLAESRESLADAAEAYERDGMARPEAERRAVEEFGDLSRLVPAYQEELAMAQGRRTALVVLLALVVQHTAAEVAWRQFAGPGPWVPGGGYALLAGAVDLLGAAGVVAALAAAVACGSGTRRLGVRPRLVRVTGGPGAGRRAVQPAGHRHADGVEADRRRSRGGRCGVHRGARGVHA
ncbi:MAG: permease prefix domain 1-containing protein, partial [Actinomycetota bacterium]